MSGEIKLDELITYTMPLEAINDAFDHMHAGRPASVVWFISDCSDVDVD